jgi:heme/copper-type cytochrome/quinol oxidase subunit 2
MPAAASTALVSTIVVGVMAAFFIMHMRATARTPPNIQEDHPDEHHRQN